MVVLSSSSINLTRLLTPQAVIWLLGKLAFIAVAGFIYFAVDKFAEFQEISLTKLELPEDENSLEKSQKAPIEKYSIISSRNIFGVVKKKKAEEKPAEKKNKEIELRLVGIHFSPGGDKIALIENSKKNEQDIFEEGDTIFDGNIKLIEITAESIKIIEDEETKILQLEDGAGDEDGDGSGEGDSYSVPEEELNTALSNLPELLSQARAVPYFRNGESIGMRLFAIRKGSLYEKLGLKNGDIVKSVNGNNIGDPTQALKLFEQLKSERRISVVLERSGEEKSLSYSID